MQKKHLPLILLEIQKPYNRQMFFGCALSIRLLKIEKSFAIDSLSKNNGGYHIQ